MNYSEIGEKAYQCWLEIPEHFSFVKLDVHVVMPNHVHGIIVIDKPDDYTRERNAGCNVETQYFASSPETQNIAFLQPPPPPSPHEQTQKPKNQFGPQSQNMASIVRGYKTGVTIYARNNNINFTWQPRFYDHIIRNDSEYQRIKDYIINNPKNWNDDKFHNK